MRADLVATQRQLVGVTVRVTDGAWYAKYAFPFFDTAWKVRFLLLDILGEMPRTTSGVAVLEGREIRIPSSRGHVPPFEAMEPHELWGLLHFDPWWALKGPPIREDLRRAAVATNIAAKLHGLDVPRRVKDVAFDTRFEKLLAVHAEDETFNERTFQEGELDLAKLLTPS